MLLNHLLLYLCLRYLEESETSYDTPDDPCDHCPYPYDDIDKQHDKNRQWDDEGDLCIGSGVYFFEFR